MTIKYFLAANVDRKQNTGTSDTVLTIGHNIKKLGNKVDYLFSDDLPIQTKRHAWSYLYFGPYIIYKLIIRRIRGTNYDVLIISGGEGYLIPFFKFLIGRKVVYINRSHGPEVGESNTSSRLSLKHRLARSIRLIEYNWATKYCDINIVSTKSEKKTMKEYYKINNEKISVVPLGISEEFFENIDDSNFSESNHKLLYVGSWIERKGIDYLTASFNQISREYPDSVLTLVGSEDNSTIRNKFVSESSINIYPIIDRLDLIDIYDSNQIFIFPTLNEGFGKVVLEAMSRGLCVITTNTGFGSEIIDHGVNGYIVPFNDYQAIVDIIKYLFENPEELKTIRNNSLESVQKYNWENTAKMTIDICENIMSQK